MKKGDIVGYDYPVKGVKEAKITKIDGYDVYLDVTLKSGVIGVHRLLNEIRRLA